MLHKRRVIQAIKGNIRRQIRRLLGITPRPKAPVLQQSLDKIVQRHAGICQSLINLWPAGFDIKGECACEIGPGDCIAGASIFLGKGAKHVDLVEIEPPAINEKQRSLLTALKDKGFPISMEVLSGKEPLELNAQAVSYHKQFVENYSAVNQHKFIFSYSVLEHVEDLETTFQVCFRSLKPQGRMLHIVDLGGHGEFEDPTPPLDFQTYPNWLYSCMYPRFHRATRRFVDDYRRAATQAGFSEVEIVPVRVAGSEYVESIRPNLRTEAKQQSVADISIIEFALTGVKNA